MHSILVVDDMEANRAVLARRLEKFGYGITCVESGAAALAALAQSLPDIILLDYMMPHMNGIEVLRELRANPATSELPVIMVTARAEGDATIEALAAGADDYVTKPIDFDVLRARIETQLNRTQDTNHLRRANAALDERVTLRSMALADLETELREEIQRRQDLERQLSQQPPQQAHGEDDVPDVRAPTELVERLTDLNSRFETLFSAIASGRVANLAQMAEFRSLLSRALASARQ